MIKDETKKETASAPKKLTVISDRDIDFTSLSWAIRAGEPRELPVEEQAQKIILSNYHIKLVE